MESFLSLISQGKVEVASLISHRFDVKEASIAYKLIEGNKKESYLGILLNYSEKIELKDPVDRGRIFIKRLPISGNNKIRLSFLGAGNYATASLLPPIISSKLVELTGLVTASGRSASAVAKKFGFVFCAEDYDELLQSDSDAIVVATRHNKHASAVQEALKVGISAYVEKPLAMSVEELIKINQAYHLHDSTQLMVGFNRRFAPATRQVLQHFASVLSPLIVNIRVNAGSISHNHWIQDPVIGGGRLIGECCHFIDLASALIGSNIKNIYTVGTNKAENTPLLNDNICVSISFENGGVASITYTADGSKSMGKEFIEVFGGGRSAQILDFKQVMLFSDGKTVKLNRWATQNKGQVEMINEWLRGLRTGIPCIKYDSIMSTSLATILAVESLCIGMPMPINISLVTD